MARLARIMLVGATMAAGLGTASMRAQTVLEDPKNAAKIFASTCSACHKSPQGLAKRGGTASFLREHYTTGPEMSAAMAAYLASAGNGPPVSAKNTEKQKEASAPASTKAQKREHLTGAPATEAGPEGTQHPSLRKQQKNAKGPAGEPARMAAHPAEPTPLPPERPPLPPASATAALSSPGAPTAPSTPSATAEPEAPAVTLDLPEPAYPTEPPADLRQPSAFSSAPLP